MYPEIRIPLFKGGMIIPHFFRSLVEACFFLVMEFDEFDVSFQSENILNKTADRDSFNE